MSSSNLPNLLRSVPVFTENPWVRVINLLPEVVIEAPVTVEVWFNGVNQPDIEPSLSVVGQSITIGLTVEQNRLLPAKGASINVKFDETYVFQQELVPTKKGGIPEDIVEEYNTPGLGVFRVSYFSSLTNASLAIEAQSAAEGFANTAATASAAAVAAAADVQNRFQGFVNQFGNELSDSSNIDWITTGGLVTGTSANGGSANTTTRTISISNGSTGRTASLTEAFDLSNLDNAAVGDVAGIRLKLSELIAGTIDSFTVEITMTVNGVNHPITYSFLEYGETGTVYEAIISYTITSLSADLAIKVAIKSDAPTQSPATSITWDSTGYFLDKYLFEQGISRIAQSTADLYTLFPHIELPYTYAIMDGGGSTDVTGYCQDYIADAVAKSGVVILKRGQNHYIAGKVDVTGGVEIKGNGSRFTPNTTEVFVIKTNERIWAHDFTIQRANTSFTATSFKFDPGYTNSGSVFERVNFVNLPDQFAIDYAKNLIIRDCNFSAGQNGLKIGHVSPSGVSDITLSGNKFDTIFLIAVSAQGANNFFAENNYIGTYSGSSFYTGRCFVINPPSGTHKNIHLVNNFCEGFTEYAVRIATVSGMTMDGVAVSGGRMRDGSSATHLGVMRISSGSGSTINDLDVRNVQIVTKATAIDIDGATNAHVIGNNIRQHTGTYSSSRALSITNSTYQSKGNTGVSLSNANVFTGSTILTEM